MASVSAIIATRRMKNKARSRRCVCLPLSQSRPTSLFIRTRLWLMSLVHLQTVADSMFPLRKHNEWLDAGLSWSRTCAGHACLKVSRQLYFVPGFGTGATRRVMSWQGYPWTHHHVVSRGRSSLLWVESKHHGVQMLQLGRLISHAASAGSR